MVIVKHMLGLLSAAAIVVVAGQSSAIAQATAPQVEAPAVEQVNTPAAEQGAPAPVAVSRAEGEAIGAFLARIQAGIAGGSVQEEAMAEQVALLLPPETTVTDATRAIVDEVLAFAQANSPSAEAVGDGLALAANAASNANNAALARMIRVRVEGAAGLLAQAFSDNFTATAAGGGAGAGGAGAGGGGAIGGAAGAVGGGTGGLGEGSSPVTQTNSTTAPTGGSTVTGFADGNTTTVVDVSPG
ncbi:hypothetical protein HGO37_12610 [Rhizobium sp. CG4]|jgi:hypothetical protein|uniref:hypothetical protein n=1 Tax=Rhizobium/Agrobacterium group TaxID=227290 RepID=UPI0020331E97|nr:MULTISPECIES: hypothetical protein [Rhizobium/Agrobacterium group]MCM2456227.1 hypothetical protein [Rhizobium sp. CG4]MDO5894520.1 hypothetical protein [Agrobacterium sp. Azo12]